ncbi:hypothetical protein HLB23_39425 [Nocardia uniformis]|uniref:Uncharacterized protein n=1 Tax=Nocardia uniformis TaxID=53432 RepID=A0A849CI48_9NOCA|nr:hypothetical protein [Nocardia uniformis]NNH75859.1 hypothetical protein [Nocardia uniformis]
MSDNTGEIVITADAARELTDRIRTHLEVACELIKQAFTSRAWAALNYSTWDDYCASEFDNSRVRIPREDRAEVVASMREIGMSTRAIAAATGLSVGTTHSALSGVQNRTPDTVTGLDDKSYQPKTPVSQQESPSCATEEKAPPSPKRRPITKAFDATRYELVKNTKSLARLAEDERFDRYAEQLAHSHRSDLIRARDALQAVIDRLPVPTTHPKEG